MKTYKNMKLAVKTLVKDGGWVLAAYFFLLIIEILVSDIFQQPKTKRNAIYIHIAYKHMSYNKVK